MKHLEITVPSELDYGAREALNRLRVNFSFCGEQFKKIVVTSSIAAEGKSFIAVNLAILLAEAGYKVGVVDADIRKSQLRTKFGLKTEDENPDGLLQYLAGKANINDVIYSTNYKGLYFVPVFRTAVNPALLFQSERFPALLNSLSEQLDYVIVDTPPMANISDGDLIASHCDGALLVVRGGVTPRGLIASSLKQLESAGCALMGVVVNRVNLKNPAYYGKYYGGYYHGYYHGYYYYSDEARHRKEKKK